MCDNHNNELTTSIHPWEAIGLGHAPYKCETVITTGFAHPETSLGECRVCGTKLINNYIIRSSEDDVFTVGCECVLALDANDPALVAHVRWLHSEHLKAQRATRAGKKAEMLLAEFQVEHPDLFAAIVKYKSAAGMDKLYLSLAAKGTLTPRQHAQAVALAIELEDEAAFRTNNPAAGHSVPVGATLTVDGQIVAQIKCRFGSMTLINTREGHQFKTFDLPYMPKTRRIRVWLKVRKHEDYKGTKQLFAYARAVEQQEAA